MAKKTLQQLDQWHQTSQGLITFGLIELVLAYIMGSRALDTGSWWEYLLTFLLLAGVVQNIVRLFKRK